MVFPERRERKVIPELLVLLVSLVLVGFKEKSEIRVRWGLRALSAPLDLKAPLDPEVSLVAPVLVALRVTLVPRDLRDPVETKVPWVILESPDLLEEEV